MLRSTLTRLPLLLIVALFGQTILAAGEDHTTYIPLIFTTPPPFTGITLEPFATGLLAPTNIVHAGDDRLFAVERDGRIRIIQANGDLLPTPFLDISDQIENGFWEQGLLGLAFHPNYAGNGRFFVYYTDTNGDTVVSQFTVSGSDPNLADPASETILLAATQPDLVHQAGAMQFGPDGYLYIALGEGGEADNAQDGQSLLGKILRIDIDSGTPYTIPPGNPFIGNPDYRDEIWALGLRNPWRFSFDAETGDLYIGDVGEATREEINFLPAGSSGLNFGWPCHEGTLDRPWVTGCQDATAYTFPIFEYDHSAVGCSGSVTGGFVYRGQAYSQINMRGRYFFADFCFGQIWSMARDTNNQWQVIDHGQFLDPDDDQPLWFSTFGQDSSGELYIGRQRVVGEIYKIKIAE